MDQSRVWPKARQGRNSGMEFKAPSSKLQAPEKHQAPNIKPAAPAFGASLFGASMELGFWSLELAAEPSSSARHGMTRVVEPSPQSASRAYQSTFRVTHITTPSRIKSPMVPM